MLGDRTANILEAAIRGFIEHGEPISSSWLYQNFDFGIKPAMIRWELNELTEKGFLEQPHYSAGRIPRDKAYEFFVERILEDTPPGDVAQSLHNPFQQYDWRSFLDTLSQELGILGIASENGAVYKSGLDELVEHLAWETRKEIMQVIEDFEALEERLENVSPDMFDDLRVYVGKKSPITKSEQLSVIAANYSPRGHNVTILAIGPKRMNYEHAIKVFQKLQDDE